MLVYVGTGNGYADPAQPMTDAVVALDLKSGKVRWFRQLIPNDTWALGCRAKNPDNPNCPDTLGPDFDFSASPALVKAGGRDLLVLPQKSGMAYALDPDKQGAPVWQFRFGPGQRPRRPVGRRDRRTSGVLRRQRQWPGSGRYRRRRSLATGERAWQRPAEPPLCGTAEPRLQCRAGRSRHRLPGAVLSGSQDGGMRAYAAEDGKMLWQFDTNREFATVNGVKARGGSMDGSGPIVAGGLLFVNSGYGGTAGRSGNVLLVFGVD